MAPSHRLNAVSISRSPFSWRALAPWVLAGSVGAVAGGLATFGLFLTPGSAGSPTKPASAAGTAWAQVCGDAAEAPLARADAPSNQADKAALLDQLMHPGAATAHAPAELSVAEQLVARARDDASLRQTLLTRFTAEQDPQARARLAAVLIGAGTPDIARFAAGMLTHPDAAQRQHGLEILATLQTDQPQARQALRNALATETDPATLGMAIQALTPGDTRSPEDVQAMTETLQQFTRRPEPTVRAAALQSLAQWGGTGAEASILGALADSDEAVVQAAVEALGRLSGRSAPANDALLNLAERPDAPPDLRQSAIGTLGDTNLDRARYERLQRLRQQAGSAG